VSDFSRDEESPLLAASSARAWLGHESLATRQKYLEPSKETERQLEAMRLPC